MKKILGIAAGAFILILAFGAFRTAFSGWGGGHTDIGFWWTVIASLLSIAGLGAVWGTVIHSRPSS